jgi:hypothetical protein
MSDQTAGTPPAPRAPLDPWPSQPQQAPESDEPFGPRGAGPDEPLVVRKTPARAPSAAPENEGHPSSR